LIAKEAIYSVDCKAILIEKKGKNRPKKSAETAGSKGVMEKEQKQQQKPEGRAIQKKKQIVNNFFENGIFRANLNPKSIKFLIIRRQRRRKK